MSFSWKPRYSPSGTFITSEGVGQWLNQWLNEAVVIYSNGASVIINNVPVPGSIGYSGLAAGNNRWAGFVQTANPWIDTSWGVRLDGAGEPSISPNGIFFAYVDPFQSNDKTLWLDFEVEGQLFHSAIDHGAITDVRVANTGIVYLKGGEVWGHWFGVQTTQRIQVAAQEFRPIPIDTPDGLYVLSQAYGGIIVRKFGESMGWKFENNGQTFYPDAVWDDLALLIKAAFTNEHGIGSQKTFPLDAPKIELSTPGMDIPIINKECWMGWFEFNFHPQIPAPQNCQVRIRIAGSPDGGIYDSNQLQFSQFIGVSDPHNPTVESIEEACRASFFPCVAYWDSIVWPRWPVLKHDDWLGIQAYCPANWSLFEFDMALRAQIDAAVQHGYKQIALICQCYTSNQSLTTDLASLIPIFGRLARDYSQINMLLVFSDQNRATGLNDHPELRPYYQELFNGITGIPGTPGENPMDNGIVNGVLVDPEKYFFWLMRDENPADYRNGLQRKREELEQYGIGQQTGSDCVMRGALYLPTSICPNCYPLPASAEQQCLGVKRDPNCFEPAGLKVYIVNDPPTQWIWSPQDDMGRYQPFNNVPEPPEPVPGDLGVIIYSYDTLVRRSSPEGMLIKFEAWSAHPIRYVELDLVEDGEPSICLEFIPENKRDGRYVRALAFKPVVNGAFTLRITAIDIHGNKTAADGIVKVTVIP